VVDVCAIGLAGQEIDDAVGGDPRRREERITRPPLVDSNRFQAQRAGVEFDRRLNVGTLQDVVVKPGYVDPKSHTATLPGWGRLEYEWQHRGSAVEMSTDYRGGLLVRRYWLMDQHGAEGPTALVETDGRLQVVDVIRFGPSLTKLADQQKVWDAVIGRVAPTMKPLVEAASLDEEGVAPLRKLWRGGDDGGKGGRAGRGDAGRGNAGRGGGGPSRKRSRGDR